MNESATWLPLTVGSGANAATIVIHALGVTATVNFVRRADQAGRLGVGFWIDVTIVAAVIFLALVAHLLEMACGRCCSCCAENSRRLPVPMTTRP